MNKKFKQQIAFALFRMLGFVVVAVLVWILGFIIVNGAGAISWKFISTAPQEGMIEGGVFPAIVGTFCLVIGSMIVAFPIGIMSAIYTIEYVGNGKMVSLIRIMTNNLGGVPSIVFGLFGMSLFVNTLGFGDSILAGSLTLGILTLPLVIRTTEEALKAIPDSYRSGSIALGATKLQTVRRIVLPAALPDITTGLILSTGRVSGETAPILFTAAAYFLPKLPDSIFSQVMALPYHLYVLATSGTDINAARPVAYGTALVLIAMVLVFNVTAAILRRRFGKYSH